MRRHFIGRQLAGLLAAIVLATVATNTNAGTNRQKTNFRAETTSKVLCKRSNMRCPRKVSKAAVKLKAKANKKQVSAKRLAKPASKPQVATTAAKKNIQLAVKQKRKRAVSRLPKPASPFFLPEIVLHVPKPPAPQTEEKLVKSFDHDDCRNELAELGVDFSIPEEVKGTGVCHVTNPVQLNSVTTSIGRVELPGTPLLNCAFARQFVVWLSDVAAPVVAGLGGAKLSSLSSGTSYQCRVRNGDYSGKMSEHAFGNAIDIAGITLTNKKRIEVTAVSDQQDPNYRLLMALRSSACGYFTTVLGPGADAAHASHYHFDLGVHGKNSNYRICE
jgi:hypothetical protein